MNPLSLRRTPGPTRSGWGSRAGTRLWDPERALVLALLLLLAGGILYPLVQVLSVAVWSESGGFTLRHLSAFFRRPLFLESLVNTLATGVLAVLFGSLVGVPLAFLTVRYTFPGRTVLQPCARCRW